METLIGHIIPLFKSLQLSLKGHLSPANNNSNIIFSVIVIMIDISVSGMKRIQGTDRLSWNLHVTGIFKIKVTKRCLLGL